MAGKKKAKGNKLSRMSEEEKIRYLQHRAAIEEEARRRKEQLISSFMKNKLKREEVFSRLNMAKINQQWRQTLRQIKCIELKKDFEDLFRCFDYSTNKRNRKIEKLLDDLNEAEFQYTRMHHSHTETINKLIKIHGQRMGYFAEIYVQERKAIYLKSKTDLDERTTSYSTEEENLQATLYKMGEACQEKISAMTSKHFSKIDEVRNNMLTELENLQTEKELQLEKIWFNFENILKQYWEQTEDRRRHYLIMKNSDYDNCRQIFENNHQIIVVTETLKNLNDQLVNVRKSAQMQLLECQTKKENARQLLQSLKRKVATEIENDKKKIILLSTVTSKKIEDLKGILAKGEQILHLQSLCRKLETLNEKVCPEGSDKPQLTEDEEKALREQITEFSEPLAEKFYNQSRILNGFWKRYNRALLEKEALALHYQSLHKEQKLLKLALKSYLSDLAVKKQVSHANGVQIQHQRPHSYILRRPKSTFSTVFCLEAAHSPSIRQTINTRRRRS